MKLLLDNCLQTSGEATEEPNAVVMAGIEKTDWLAGGVCLMDGRKGLFGVAGPAVVVGSGADGYEHGESVSGTGYVSYQELPPLSREVDQGGA